MVSGRAHVLHLDDDRSFLEVTKHSIERRSEELMVESTTDPAVALDRVEAGETDCVLTDYEMPGTDGIEVLRSVRELDDTLPVVLYTGKGSEEVAAAAIDAGVTEYIRKASGTDHTLVLVNRLRNAIERAEAAAANRVRSAALDAAREGICILDADYRFRYANPAYRELYGYEPGELAGEPWTTVHPESETERVRAEVFPAVDADGEWAGHSTGLRADGTTFAESKSVAPLPDGGLVIVVTDADAPSTGRSAGQVTGE